MFGADESAAEKGVEEHQEAKTPPAERRKMSELEDAPRTYSGAILAVIGVALLCALGGLIWTYMLSGRMAREEAALAEANQQNLRLAAELRETDARLKVTADELGKSLGLTQKQMDARAQQIIARE